jgi:tetratricopeptide (TPR) repeat protein
LLPIIGGTLCFGAVHTPAVALLSALTVAAAVAVIAATPVDRGPGRLTVGWLLGGGVLGLLALAELVPVGPGLRTALQPQTGPVVEASLALGGGGPHALALAPAEALVGLAWGGALVWLSAAVAVVHRPRDRALRGATALVLLGVGVLLINLVHKLSGAASIWWLSGVPSGPLRVPFFAPFVNPNHAGALSAALLPLCLLLLARRDLTGRLIGGLSALALSAGVLWTGSRGALIAGAAGVALTLALAGPRWLSAGVAALVTATVAGGLLAGPTQVAARLDQLLPTAQRLQDPLGQRPALWADALGLAAAQPLGPLGAGGFGAGWQQVRTMPLYVSASHAHNDLLQAIVEHGVLVGLGGLALVLIPLAAGLRGALAGERGRSRDRLAAWAGVLTSLLCTSLWDFPAHIGALALLGAFAVGGLLAALGRHAHRQPLPLPLPGLAVPAAAIAALGLWAGAGDLVAPGAPLTRGAPVAALARMHLGSDPGTAEALAAAALRQEPLQLTALVTLAEARLAKGDVDGAAAALEVATAAAPHSPWPWFARARLEHRRGRAVERRAAWQRGLANNLPDNDDATAWVREALAAEDDPGTMVNQIIPPRADRLTAAAITLAAAGDELMARACFEQAVALDPSALVPYARHALAWGDPAGAIDLLDDAPAAGCEAQLLRGDAELARGAPAAAATALAAALERCRTPPPTLRLRLGLARCEAGDPEGAAMAEAALAGVDEPAPVHHRLVACLRAQGRARQARPHLEALEQAQALRADERALLDRLRAGLPL